MFTGIIESLGTITGIQTSGQGRRFSIDADIRLDQTKIGDSISVSGACLTAVRIEDRRFEVDVAPETLAKTTFGSAKIGNKVNLERAMRLSDRIDGHLVSGHIDTTGIIAARETIGNAIIITVQAPAAVLHYMIVKGSVAVDGISLTINNCTADSFSVSIIPHTAKLTTIGFKKNGDAVNLETDMIGKYVERFVRGESFRSPGTRAKESGIDLDFLARSGFLK